MYLELFFLEWEYIIVNLFLFINLVFLGELFGNCMVWVEREVGWVGNNVRF